MSHFPLLNDELLAVAGAIGHKLRDHGWRVCCAESCTGGLIAAALTGIGGSSAWFECGFVTYSNRSKQVLLGVPEAILREHGAVSEATARAMAQGALARGAGQIALAVTGVAGPDGGTADKPVGTVWLAWATAERVEAQRHLFGGDRTQFRRATAIAALQGLVALLPSASAGSLLA